MFVYLHKYMLYDLSILYKSIIIKKESLSSQIVS